MSRKTPDLISSASQEKLPDENLLADQLNKLFQAGNDIAEASSLLQKVPKPIVVDFNNVLVNNREPLEANPDALQSFHLLEEIGTPLILTAASGWEAVQETLKSYKYWSNKTILITSPNFSHLMHSQVFSPKAAQLRVKFTENVRKNTLAEHPHMQNVDWNSPYLWVGAIADKKVAFAFMKPHLIPIIDDYHHATNGNPGMYGIQVDPWYAPGERFSTKHREQGKTFSQAVEEVARFYTALERR